MSCGRGRCCGRRSPRSSRSRPAPTAASNSSAASGTAIPCRSSWSQSHSSETFPARSLSSARKVSSSRSGRHWLAPCGEYVAQISRYPASSSADCSSATVVCDEECELPAGLQEARGLAPADPRLHPVEGRRGEHAVEGPLGKLDVLEASDVEAHERGVADAPAGDLDHPRAGSTASMPSPCAARSSVSFPVPHPTSTTWLPESSRRASQPRRRGRRDSRGARRRTAARRRRRPCRACGPGAADDTVGGYAAGAGLGRF